MYKRTADQRIGEQCNKRARGQENKITKSSGGALVRHLTFSPREQGHENKRNKTTREREQ
jgi:hypothetical protein